MCDHDGPNWMDIALAGALSEEISEEERQHEPLRKEVEEDKGQELPSNEDGPDDDQVDP